MKQQRTWVLLIGLLLGLLAAPVSARKWTSNSGKFTVEAELVDALGGNARLKRQDGKIITVPIAKLSKSDREFLASDAKAKLATAKATRDKLVAMIEGLNGTVFVTRGQVTFVSLRNGAFRPDLKRNKVTDATLVHLKGLKSLGFLSVKGYNITDAGLEHLKGLKSLHILDLSTTRITDAGLEHLKGLTKLERLELEDTRITDAGLKQLKGLSNLETLRLGETNVTDAGLEHLKGLKNLQSLRLVKTKVTDEGVKKLQQALPNCKIYR